MGDLAQSNLPRFDEPLHPRLGRYLQEHTRAWKATISRADAIVLVVPEGNYGFPAAAKNALDYRNRERAYKRVGIASCGDVPAGTRAMQMLKQEITAVKLTPGSESVSIPFLSQEVGPDGLLRANDVMDRAAGEVLAEPARREEGRRRQRLAAAVAA